MLAAELLEEPMDRDGSDATDPFNAREDSAQALSEVPESVPGANIRKLCIVPRQDRTQFFRGQKKSWLDMDANRCIDDMDPDFEYTDTNASKKWLFSYPGKLMPNKNELSQSLFNETFSEPPRIIASQKGKRKKLLEHFYRQIIAEELQEEFDSEKIVVEPYETNYSVHFKNPDDMPLPGECLSKNEQIKRIEKSCPDSSSKLSDIEKLKMKYPLYTSRPFTFAAQTIGKDKFGIKSTISKPPEQNYDNIEY